MEQNNQTEIQKTEIQISQKTIINLLLSFLVALSVFVFLFLIGYNTHIVNGVWSAFEEFSYAGILSENVINCRNYDNGYGEKCNSFTLFGMVLKQKYYVVLFLWPIFFVL